MTCAITIGSYLLDQFVHLNVLQCRRVFGPKVSILISDDISKNSAQIKELAARLDTYYVASGPRGHFAGDMNHAVNALAFAEDQGADLAIKLSQRFVLAEPAAREVIERYFADKNVWLGLPGRIPASSIKRAESRFFAGLSVLTDIVVIRTGTLSARQLKDRYEVRVRNPQSHIDKLAESCWANLMDTHFATHTVQMPELTHHYPGRPPIYLRKAQNEPADYERLARERGLSNFNAVLVEWSRLENAYRPHPTFV